MEDTPDMLRAKNATQILNEVAHWVNISVRNRLKFSGSSIINGFNDFLTA